MAGRLSLDVTQWAAIVSADAAEDLGAAAPVSEIPAGLRRRLPPFSRDVLRCALPLLRAQPHTPIIYAASHGDLDSTVTLLTDLARREVLSPALFAMSVHNAPTGALSLALGMGGDDIALAADEDSFLAGLTEAYARLACDAEQVLLILAEAPLPEVYRNLDEEAPGVFLALMLRAVEGEQRTVIEVSAGRAGAIDVARALASGRRQLRFAPPHVKARAA